ncbi:MAG: NYN domain-containing protein [Ardenticatenales bacterium]|nr:NYN domain-containing protein [Ardenticatenales bacterium]
MESDNRSFGGPDVAVFIDFENIYISVRNRYDASPNFESIMELAQRYGRVTIARAYADWYRYPRVTNALYANAIEPMYVPTYHYDRDEGRTGRAIKNSVDMYLCIDMMKTLHAFGNIGTYVLVTGDRDFIPLVNAIRQQGKRTVVIGVAQATANHLAQSADEFLFYSQVDEDIVNAADKVERDPYEVLVEAVRAARERGHVSTLATLKLVMLELVPSFDETKTKDRRGRLVGSFKDFVREAERRKLVQIFSSGSVNEVLLPGEDPYAVSQFAPDMPAAETTVTEEDVDDAELDAAKLTTKDWAVFEEALRQFTEPVLFIQIYDALRGLRNKEIIDLSNQDIKAMIKIAINEGLLVRTTRGPHAYYQIAADKPFQPVIAG